MAMSRKRKKTRHVLNRFLLSRLESLHHRRQAADGCGACATFCQCLADWYACNCHESWECWSVPLCYALSRDVTRCHALPHQGLPLKFLSDQKGDVRKEVKALTSLLLKSWLLPYQTRMAARKSSLSSRRASSVAFTRGKSASLKVHAILRTKLQHPAIKEGRWNFEEARGQSRVQNRESRRLESRVYVECRIESRGESRVQKRNLDFSLHTLKREIEPRLAR